MTIARSETDLNESDYAAMPDSTGSMSAQITLQRYGPVWADHPNDTDNGRSGECFDAILVGQYLLRAYGCTISEVSADYMPSEVSGISDATWNTIDCTAIVSIDINVPVSLATGTSPAARMFYVDASGTIRRSNCTDITTGSFGSGIDVYKPGEEILQIAAISNTKVHYITKTSQDNRRFHCAEYYGATWNITNSDVYWPYPIHGFDAIPLDETTDLLVIATDLPPLIGSRMIGTEVQTEVNAVQALVAFEVKNGRWSEWLPFDTIDRVPPDYSTARDDVRLSYHNDLLFATYERAGGDGDYEYTKPGVTRSGDGKDWEYPEFIPDAAIPFVILPRDDYLYAVGVSGTLRSPKCTWAGQDPVEYDVTPYVLGMESQAAEIRNSNVSLANPPTSVADVFQGTLAGELPLSDDRLQLEYKLGYWIDGAARCVRVSTEDVIQRGEQRGLPQLNLGLTSQDYLGRVNRTRSDYAAEWPSMQCGKDPFDDTTGTGYGGLRHMAPIKPSFKADDGILNLISKNKEGIAISTFVSDALCGSAQTGLQLVETDKDEYAGIAFRVFDKDNLYYCAYFPDENNFRLYRRTGIVSETEDYTDSLLATSDTMDGTPDWSASLGTDSAHYMKLLVEYNKLTLWASDDGIEWVTVSWATPAGNFVELPGVSVYASVWSGRFGVIGRGYSDQDTPPPWDPPPWVPPAPPEYYDYGMVILSEDQMFRSLDFFDVVDPTWVDIRGSITGNILYNVVAWGDDGYVTSHDTSPEANKASIGLWHTPNFLDDEPTWTLVKTLEEARSTFHPLYNYSDIRFGPLAMQPGGKCGVVFRCGGLGQIECDGMYIYVGDSPQETVPMYHAGTLYFGSGDDADENEFVYTCPRLHTNFAAAAKASRNYSPSPKDFFYVACGHWDANSCCPGIFRAADYYGSGNPVGGISCIEKGCARACTSDTWVVVASGRVYYHGEGGQYFLPYDDDVHGASGIDSVGSTGMYLKYVAGESYERLFINHQEVAKPEDVFIISAGVPARLSNRPIFIERDVERIVWIAQCVASAAGPGSVRRAIVYSTDGGYDWVDKTGNLFDICAGNQWSGATHPDEGNAVCFAFAYQK